MAIDQLANKFANSLHVSADVVPPPSSAPVAIPLRPRSTSTSSETESSSPTRKRVISDSTRLGTANKIMQHIKNDLEERNFDEAVDKALQTPLDEPQDQENPQKLRGGSSLHKAMKKCWSRAIEVDEIDKAVEIIEQTPFAYDGYSHRRAGYIDCVNAYIRLLKWDEGRCLAEKTQSYDVCYAYVTSCLNENKPEEAKKILPFSNAQWPNLGFFYYPIIDYYLQHGMIASAQDLLTEAPKNEVDCYVREEYLEKAGMPKEIPSRVFRMAYPLEEIHALKEQIRDLLDNNSVDEAVLKALTTSSAIDSGKWLHKFLKECRKHCLSNNDIAKAVEIIEKTPFAFGGYAHRREGYSECVKAHIKAGNYKEGLALAIKTNSYDVCLAYVCTCLEEKRPDQAELIFDCLPEKWKNFAHFYYEIIRGYLDQRLNPTAFHAAFKLLKKAPVEGVDVDSRDEYLEKLEEKFRRRSEDLILAQEAAELITDQERREVAKKRAQIISSSPMSSSPAFRNYLEITKLPYQQSSSPTKTVIRMLEEGDDE